MNGIPWQVGILDLSYNTVYPFCGGTIIGPSTILTAAHCLLDHEMNINAMKVHVGIHDIQSYDQKHKQ